ncbi:MAG: hypothetical protein GF384_03465 [Elusimicrobia bacterium]|nr:hypothetical protein [Elusimicrobiota bacterium]MBD3411972.1 hypothetical protein [Elusimicrobiota bacterium]
MRALLKKSGRITQGNKALKTTLVECAWAASHTKHTYLGAKYRSLAGRRGKKKALIALGHKILIMSYHVIKRKIPYRDLGELYLAQRKKKKIVKKHAKMLRKLGYEVTLKEAP